MNQEDREYLAKLDRELETGEFDELKKLWRPDVKSRKELEKMSIDDLRAYFKELLAALSPYMQEKKKEVATKVITVFDNALAKVKTISELKDMDGVVVEELGPNDGYKPGAYKITFKDGSIFTCGDRTESGERKVWIERIVKKQREFANFRKV